MEEPKILKVEAWMRGILLLAGVYNLGWGFFIYNFPDSFFQWVGQTGQNAPAVISWQGIGVMIFGVVYILIAIYPTRLWYLLAVGIASKVGGAIGFYYLVMETNSTRQFLFHLLMNDLIWVIPFTVILIRVYQVQKQSSPSSYEKFT